MKNKGASSFDTLTQIYGKPTLVLTGLEVDRNAVLVRQMHQYYRSVLSIKFLSFNLYCSFECSNIFTGVLFRKIFLFERWK